MKLTFLGDYLGAAAGEKRLSIAYIDNTVSESHVSFAAVPLP